MAVMEPDLNLPPNRPTPGIYANGLRGVELEPAADPLSATENIIASMHPLKAVMGPQDAAVATPEYNEFVAIPKNVAQASELLSVIDADATGRAALHHIGCAYPGLNVQEVDCDRFDADNNIFILPAQTANIVLAVTLELATTTLTVAAELCRLRWALEARGK